MQDDTELDKSFRVTFVVHLVLTIAPLFYALIIAFLGDRQMFPHLIESIHVVVLGVLAVAAVLLLYFRERMATTGARTALDGGQSTLEALAAAQLIRGAMNETVALLSLLAFLLTANIGMSLVFVVVGMYAMVRTRPNKDEWRKASGGRR
jgi:hypothetical protein